MGERALLQLALIGQAALALPVLVALLFRAAPYGRHAAAARGPVLSEAAGWVLMEAPAPLLFALCALLTPRPLSSAELLLIALWELHYLHRAFVYPLRRRGRGRTMPLGIAAMGFAFNVVNAWLNGRWLTALGPPRGAEWLRDGRFWLGAALFAAGLAVNVSADEALLRLRRDAGGYAIPRGGLFERVSCPNYLGECVEWIGYAIAAWNPAAAVFALWTAANLVPRAIAHHRWYRQRFADYPVNRRAIVPSVL